MQDYVEWGGNVIADGPLVFLDESEHEFERELLYNDLGMQCSDTHGGIKD